MKRLLFIVLAIALVLPMTATAQDGGMEYKEAPMLAEMVAAGELPPVEERLPANPRVIPVYEEIGTYGGTWRRGYKGLSDSPGPSKIIEEQPIKFYMPDPDTIELVLTWVDQFEANEDSSVFTIHIREGLRWSDGEFVTTDDVRFWYEDLFLNEELHTSIPPRYKAGGEAFTVEIIDDYTFTVNFVTSYPFFPYTIAKFGTPWGVGGAAFVSPEHYLKNFHADYISGDDMAALMEEYEVEVWTDVTGEANNWYTNPDLPMLNAWTVKVPPPADQMIMERNPYYYAVDPEGNQLPYIDSIAHNLFENVETLNLWAVQGNIDMQNRHMETANYTLYKENEESGNYRVVPWSAAYTVVIWFNQNVPDDTLRELYADARFREALNIAIDREEINDIVYLGLAEPRQGSPVSGSPQYDAEFEAKWTGFDPDRANELLDDMGLTERDSEGFRLRPDGETLSLNIEQANVFGAATDALEMVTQYWADIGVKALYTVHERSIYQERLSASAPQLLIWVMDRSSVVVADPLWYQGFWWAHKYFNWYMGGGEEGEFEADDETVEVPPEDHPLRTIWAAIEEAKTATTEEEALAIFQEGVIGTFKDNIFTIGIVGEELTPTIVSNRMHNVPAGIVVDDILRGQGVAATQQFFIREE